MKKSTVRLLAFSLAAGLAGLAALLYRPDVPASELEARYADAASRFVEIDGLRIHFKDEGAGPTLLLLHGTASSLHTWDGWASELGGDFRLLRLDLPGFGLTGPDPLRDYSIARRLEVLAAFLDRLGVGECAVAGNSLGGHIAWQLAARRPERVGRLVLIDPAGYPEEAQGDRFAILDLGRVPGLRRLLARLTPRFLVAAGVRQAYGNPALLAPEVVDRYYRLLLREGNRGALLDSLAGEGAERDHRPLATITQPALVMWGREDRLIPVALAERFHRDLPRSELKIYDGVGHMAMEEIPARSARDARAFLQRSDRHE